MALGHHKERKTAAVARIMNSMPQEIGSRREESLRECSKKNAEKSSSSFNNSIDENNDNHGKSLSDKNRLLLPKPSVVRHAVVFFCCMIVMELAIEGTYKRFSAVSSLPLAITLFQFAFCVALPLGVSRGESLGSFPKSIGECAPYASLSLVVFGSTCLATMSVRYVSYPTKVVFKSAKLIPTMIVASFLQKGARYAALDYLAALLLCAGAAGYGFGGENSSSSNDEKSNSCIGIVLLLISIFCDAFTPNIQQRLMSPPAATQEQQQQQKQQTTCGSTCTKFVSSVFVPRQGAANNLSASELMVNANAVGFSGLFVFMALTGSLWELSNAVLVTHPLLCFYLAIVGFSLSMAVLSYTKLIRESGSVVAVAVATVRKVATVVLSYVVYPKRISALHVVSGLLVLVGILVSVYSKQRSPPRQQQGCGGAKK